MGAIHACSGDSTALQIGVIGFADVLLLALTLYSTGFSSIWFVLLPIPKKNGVKGDWGYQLSVNLIGSSIGGTLAVVVVTALF